MKQSDRVNVWCIKIVGDMIEFAGLHYTTSVRQHRHNAICYDRTQRLRNYCFEFLEKYDLFHMILCFLYFCVFF